MTRLWPDLVEVVKSFAGRIESFKGSGSVIRFDHACTAFAGDVIGQTFWDKEERLLDDPSFSSELCVLLYRAKSMADSGQSGPICFKGWVD